MIGMVLKFLQQQKRDCVWFSQLLMLQGLNLVSAHIVDLIEVSKPFQAYQFTVLNNSGKRIRKKYPHATVKLCFETVPNTLSYLHA